MSGRVSPKVGVGADGVLLEVLGRAKAKEGTGGNVGCYAFHPNDYVRIFVRVRAYEGSGDVLRAVLSRRTWAVRFNALDHGPDMMKDN